MTSSAYAIIDIGSNSLRLVIFKELQRYPLKILDDSVLCRLGDLDEHGNLKAERMEMAYAALRRYKAICHSLRVDKIYPIATAVVRDAANQAPFIKRVKELCGASVQIISAEEEAHYSASGVISAFSSPHGLVADLGGSSMELIRLDQGRLCEKISIPVGPLALSKTPESERDLLLERCFHAASPLFARSPETLYLVGGSARAFAKAYMEKTNHPIEIIHGYEMTSSQALEALDWLESQTPTTLDLFSLRVSRRKAMLPLAARPLRFLIESAHPKRIIFSNYGLREGFAHTLLPREEQRIDALLASCQTVASVYEKFPLPTAHIGAWMEPILTYGGFTEKKWDRLLAAMTHLSDCGWTAFHEHRADYAFSKVMHSPWILCTHQERLILALALYYRYDGKSPECALLPYGNLLGDQELSFARTVGLLLSFYAILFDNMPDTWKLFPYTLKDDVISISAPTELLERDRMEPHEKAFAQHLGLRIEFV